MTSFQQRTEQLSERLATTLSKLPKELSPKYVHRLRTDIRRIESLVSYAQPDLGKKQKKALEEMSILRKRAGKVRDLDIQKELLNEIANGSTAADRRTISDALKQKREKRALRLLATVNKAADSKFLCQVRKIVTRAAANAASPHPDPLSEARQRLAGLQPRLLQSDLHPRDLHHVRIEIKKIRYVAELAEETPERQQFMEELKAAQDALGSWHDWAELAKTAEKQFRQRMNCPLVVEVRALLAAKQATATAAVRQIFGKHPEVPARKETRAAVAPRELVQHAG